MLKRRIAITTAFAAAALGCLALVQPAGATEAHPAGPAPAAVARPANTTFETVGTDINMRSGAGSNYGVVFTIVNEGSPVSVDCWEPGTSVNGDSVWYDGSYSGHGGFVAGYWLNTGHDPNPAIPECNVGNP